MNNDPKAHDLSEPKLPHLELKELLAESDLLDDHGEAIVGDRKHPPKFERDLSTRDLSKRDLSNN